MSDAHIDNLQRARAQLIEQRRSFVQVLAGPHDRGKTELSMTIFGQWPLDSPSVSVVERQRWGRHDVEQNGFEAVGRRCQIESQTSQDAVSIIELGGVIKSFDVSKGYGIIVLDNGIPDILLSVACLRRGGFDVAHEGARVVVEVLQYSRGLQAFRVFSMDESTALPTQMVPSDTHVSITATRELGRARVKWLDRPRGFGFFASGGDTPDVFMHIETLRRFGLTELLPSRFKGLMALGVLPEDVPLQPASR